MISIISGFVVGLLGIILVLVSLGQAESVSENMVDLGNNISISSGFNAGLNGFFNIIYIALLGCIGVSVGFSILSAASNPKGAVTSIIGILALGVIFLIGYSIADSSVQLVGRSPDEAAEFLKDISENSIRLGGMAINAMYILLLTAVGSIVGGEIYRSFK
jgi:hypothetical protein